MIQERLREHIEVFESSNLDSIETLAKLIDATFNRGNKVLVCGNGGSAADAQHFAAELVGRFKKERESLPCIALTTDTSILTAIGNDYGYKNIFSRQIEAIASQGDLLIAISTSGNSPNIVSAIESFVHRGTSVLLTGSQNGKAGLIADVVIKANSDNTARIQEFHIFALHIACELVDDY